MHIRYVYWKPRFGARKSKRLGFVFSGLLKSPDKNFLMLLNIIEYAVRSICHACIIGCTDSPFPDKFFVKGGNYLKKVIMKLRLISFPFNSFCKIQKIINKMLIKKIYIRKFS